MCHNDETTSSHVHVMLVSLRIFLAEKHHWVGPFVDRPQGIMLQILSILIFQISQKIGSLCSLLFFLCSTLL